jgi:hypothetical protein
MTLGLLSAPRLPRGGVAAITAAGAAWGVYAWIVGFDRFGAALFTVYALCLFAGRKRPASQALYAVMFVLALSMEQYGTALGNWTWAAVAPGLALSQANPPYSAGAFYCLLDLLVLAALSALPVPAREAAAAD